MRENLDKELAFSTTKDRQHSPNMSRTESALYERMIERLETAHKTQYPENLLENFRSAVAEALEIKRSLGHYAVVYDDEKDEILELNYKRG